MKSKLFKQLLKPNGKRYSIFLKSLKKNVVLAKLHCYRLSEHSRRAQLALSLKHPSYELVDVDLTKGKHKRAEFIKVSTFYQVPVLDDDGTTLFDSNAILVYLATKYDAERCWLPCDPKGQADVQA